MPDTSPEQQTLTIHQALELAVQHQTAGDLSKAESIFRQILQTNPNQHDALHLLGVIACQKGDFPLAIDLITEVLSLKPNFAEAHYNLGISLQELGKLDEAVTCYQKALILKPDHAEANHNLGLALQNLGRPDEAVFSYHNALSIKPDYVRAHNNLGNALKELGLLDQAMSSYQKAVASKPDYAEAHINLGVTLTELGHLDNAVASYHKAVAIKPNYAEAHYNLGIAFTELGRLDEAVASYYKAVAIKPDYAEAHFNLGLSLQELWNLDGAAARYKQALSLKPEDIHVSLNLAHVLKEQGKHQEAVAYHQQSFIRRTSIQPVGNAELSPATSVLFLELTNKCNFHCDFCPSDSQKRALGFMDLELAKRTYEEVEKKQLVPKVALHLMGEPTLHPKLIDILNFGASKNVRTELVTNGSTLVAKVVPRILDALYGTIVASHMTPTKETYHFRGKVGLSWDRYIDNIRLLVREYMKRLAIGGNIRNRIDLRVMVTKDTKSNVNIIEYSEQVLAILTEWIDFTAEVELELSLPPFKRQEPNINALLQGGHHAFNKYRLQQGIVLTFWEATTFANTRVSNDYELQSMEETVFCPHPFKDFGVLWNGDVTLCCMDYDGQLKVGNIRDSSIESVMQGEAAQNLRASMLGRRPLPSVCQTCQARPVKREECTPDTISEHIY